MTFSLKTWLVRFWGNLRSRADKDTAPGGRPKSVSDLCRRFDKTDQSYKAFTLLWGEWLSEFHANPSIVAICMPPPEDFPQNYAALIAGTVEYLVLRHNYPMPGWLNDHRYFLGPSDLFTPLLVECPIADPVERERLRVSIMAHTPKALLKRGVLIRAKALERGGSSAVPDPKDDSSFL